LLNEIAVAVPADLTVHLVLDNYATTRQGNSAWFLRILVPPALRSSQFLLNKWRVGSPYCRTPDQRGSHYSVRELESAILEFIEVHNEQPNPLCGQESDAILNSIGRFASVLWRPCAKICKNQ